MGTWKFKGGKFWNGEVFVANVERSVEAKGETDRVVQLGDEDLILPGVIDQHVHMWAPELNYSVTDGQLYADGVVGIVEGGSFGYEGWLEADRFWRNTGNVDVRAFMEICPGGCDELMSGSIRDPEEFLMDKLVEIPTLAEPGRFIGYKVHLGKKNIENDRKMMKIIREAADRTGTRIMVHVSSTWIPFPELISYFKKGDILTHCYTEFDGRPVIVNSDYKVYPEYFEARKRGVIMDVGHSSKHFSWKLYREAMAQGAMFDTISTDLTKKTFKDTKTWRLYDFAHLISSFIAAGVPLDDVFKAVTKYPAETMGVTLDPDKRTLIYKKVECEAAYGDGPGEFLCADFEYRPYIFIDNGTVVRNQLSPAPKFV